MRQEDKKDDRIFRGEMTKSSGQAGATKWTEQSSETGELQQLKFLAWRKQRESAGGPVITYKLMRLMS